MLILPDSISRIGQAAYGLIPSAKWLAKGLELVFMGDQVVWSRTGGGPWALTKNGTPKLQMGKFGRFPGFGSTYGTGTTDRLDGGILPFARTGWRSIVAHYYANGTGGGGLGRIFQDSAGTGLQYGETMAINTGSVIYYGICAGSGTYCGRATTATAATGRWQSFGVTHDQRTVGQVADLYLDGVTAASSAIGSPTGSYQPGVTNLVWGNRPSDSARCWDGIIGPVLIFDGALSAEDHAALDRNPLQIFDTAESELWVPSASGAILAGASLIQDTASGSTTTAIPIAGVAATITTESGAMMAQITFSGAALEQVLAAGAITTQISFSGAAVSQALAAGNLTTSPSGFSAAASSAATASGQLTTGIPLAGAPSSISISAGGITTGIPLAGAAVSVCNVTGNLLVNAGWTAAALSQASASGSLSTQIRFNAAAAAQALAAGALTSLGGAQAFIDPRYSIRFPRFNFAVTFPRSHYEVTCQ